jgi:PAS domain S-box-containing protein
VLSGILLEDMGNLRSIGADAFVAKMPLDRLLPTLRQVIGRLEEGCDEVLVEGFEGMFRREVVGELLEEKRFRDLLLSSLTEGVVQLDLDGRILSANSAFAAQIGLRELDVLDRALADLLGMAPDEIVALLAGAREGRLDGASPVQVRACGRSLCLRISPVEHGSETVGFMVLSSDQTQQLATEAECVALRRRMAESEKLTAMGRMVAGIAHELNNPLTGVLGYAQLLAQRPRADAPDGPIDRIFQEAQRCQRVVARLLAFAQEQSPRMEPVEINTFLQDSVRALAASLAPAGIEVDLRLDSDLPPVFVDPGQFREVVGELIGNARRSMAQVKRKGRVTVTTRREAERVAIEIADNGPGIPPENLGRVFDPFFTTADVGEGAGLGLSAAYGIVRQHGGTLRASSQPGEGTCMRIEVPHSGPAPRRAGIDSRPAPSRVLVVDDEAVILDLLADLLESRGVTVETASSGREALQKLRTAEFDAVLLDMKMPGMSGREVYETLGRVDPRMQRRVVFATGDMVTPETRRFLEEVGSPVLAKPFEIDHATDLLVAFLGREQAAAAGTD